MPLLAQRTYVEDDVAALSRVHAVLASHGQTQHATAPTFYVSGAHDDDRVEIPESVHQVLLQVIEAMEKGLAVTVAPHTKMLTTQQAADLLSMSRPSVIRLLDAGAIDYERTGTHRRILLTDVLQFREKRRQDQYERLASMGSDIDDEDSIDDTLNDLREARRLVAAQRRTAHN